MRHTLRLAGAALAAVAVGTMASAAGSVPTNVIYGTDGNDIIGATPAADVIYAKSGHDTVSDVGSGDVVYASSGNDTILLDSSAHVTGAVVDANVGNDVVAGGIGVDDSFVNLGSGDDHLLLDGCGNRVLGGSGADAYENHAQCEAEAGTFDLGGGNDLAWVSHASRAVLGNGNDNLTTHSPSVVNAGSGNDLVRFDGGGDATVYLGAGNDALLLAGASLVSAFGNSGQDEVSGSFDDSVINTESGEDVIELLPASRGNRLAGGGNRDVARLASASSGTSCLSLERIVDLDGNPRSCS